MEKYYWIKEITLESCQIKKGDKKSVEMIECDTNYNKVLNSIKEDNEALHLQLAAEKGNKELLMNNLTKNISSAEERLKIQDAKIFEMKNYVILLDAELNEYKDKQFYLDLKFKKDNELKIKSDELYNKLKIKYDELNNKVLNVKLSELDRLTKHFNGNIESLKQIMAEITQKLTQRDDELCECVKQKNNVQSGNKLLMESHSKLLTRFNTLKIQCDEQTKTIDMKNDTEESLTTELDTVKETLQMKDADLMKLHLRISELTEELSYLK
ncbi:Hypothetical protein CINCED_3A000094 [Cinara cedri]|uniref:Uncharacterized protein n=1 Tax=Cinara cedri TaxID=506608 RepID=A0A5E4MGY6_9HEMI|nr:Hypothetical protein CINCED_3A000094 [Cinara cedri]